MRRTVQYTHTYHHIVYAIHLTRTIQTILYILYSTHKHIPACFLLVVYPKPIPVEPALETEPDQRPTPGARQLR